MSIGTNLKKLRKNKKFSQELLAENLDVSRQAVSKWERDISRPSTTNLMKIADLFGVDIDLLINESGLDQEKESIYNANPLYILGAVLCLIAFMIGIYFSQISPLFIALGVLSPMGMSYFLMKLV